MGNPLLEKKANPAATAVNNAGNGHGSMPGDDPQLEQVENAPHFGAREIMHDDSGAQTGLRRRPDYGESDSFTSTMNRENSKAAYVIQVTGDGKVASADKPMYVAEASWKSLKVVEAKLTPDPAKAARFPRYTAWVVAKALPKLQTGFRSSIQLP